MIKKIFGLFAAMLILSIACKKEEICTDKYSYEVVGFDLKINSENIGLFPADGKNTETTITTKRNQFMFIPEKLYSEVHQKSIFNWDFIPSAYAKNCVDVENSKTTFDVNKTHLSINRDINLDVDNSTIFVGQGQNLLSNPKLRAAYFKEIISNAEIHAGFEFPVTLSVDFLKQLKGQQVEFTLKMITTLGFEMSSSVDVVVDVNA